MIRHMDSRVETAGTGISCTNKRKKSAHMDGAAGHHSTKDALPLSPRSGPAHAAAIVSGRTSMAEQPGTATDSNESTPLPSYPARYAWSA